MDITDRSNIGYTFWIAPRLRSSRDYNQLVSRIEREGYKLSQPEVFIIVDDTSRMAINPSDVQEISTDMFLNNDMAIYSILRIMGRKPVIMLAGNNEVAHSLISKRALAVAITRQMGDTRCTIISEPLYVVNTMDNYDWESLIGSNAGTNPSDKLNENSLSALRGIQFSRGQPITTLYNLTSYLLSCLNWEDPSLIVAGAAHISEVSHSQLETILSQGGSCKGENTWGIHGYMILRVDKMHGYNLNIQGLPYLLSSLGGRGFKLYSILLGRYPEQNI